MDKKEVLLKTVSSALVGAAAGAMLAAFYSLIICLIDKSVPYWTITTRLAPDLMILGAFVVPVVIRKDKFIKNRLFFSMFWILVGYYAFSTLRFYAEVIVMLTSPR